MKKLILVLVCVVLCVCVVSCADSADEESGKSAPAGEYDGRATIAYENALVCEGGGNKSIDENRYVTTCTFESSFGSQTVSYTTNYDVITTSEEWSEICAIVWLSYKSCFFEENALVVVQIQGAHTTKVEGMLCLVTENSVLTPVIQVNYVKESGQTADVKYWYVTAEVSKADIEGYGLGELEVVWNITEAE